MGIVTSINLNFFQLDNCCNNYIFWHKLHIFKEYLQDAFTYAENIKRETKVVPIIVFIKNNYAQNS